MAALHGKTVEAQDLLDALQRKDLKNRPRFPLLKGPKIGPLWVRMLAFPGGVDVRGIDEIPVAVDTHVQRVTEMLGFVPPQDLNDHHRTAIQQAWFDAVGEAGPYGGPSRVDGTSAGIDPALWALGREGCASCEQGGTKQPISAICELCILGRVHG